MRNRRLPFAVVTFAVLLAACGPAAVTPVATSAKPAVRQPVSPSGAGLWFAPVPANPRDLLALADPNAAWLKGAAATAVFQLSAASIAPLGDTELASLVTGLKQRGLPIALLVPALTGSSCGQLRGSPDAAGAPDLLRRLKSAGAEVRFIAMDRPASTGMSCGQSAMEIATSVGAWASNVRSVVPQAAIGDAELLGTSSQASALAAWMQAYATVTGSPLAFLHMDLDWSIGGWPVQLRQLGAAARQAGGGFGVIEQGNQEDGSDARWLARTADRMAAVSAAGVSVDSAVFQSSAKRSPRLLPETDDATFTALLPIYGATRTALTFSGTNGSSQLAAARLVDAAGNGIAGAPVDLTVRSLHAPGNFATVTATGTAPPDATRAIVGIRIDTENADPGPADLSLYEAGYREGSSGKQQVPDPDFAAGMLNWTATDPAMVRLQPSDRGTGQMLHLTDNPAQPLALNSGEFAVTPGASYTLSFSARLAPISRGYFALMFLGSSEQPRVILRFNPTVIQLRAVTDARGAVQWQVPATALPAELEARYAGDRAHWPALANS